MGVTPSGLTRRVLLPATTLVGLLVVWEATVRVLDLPPFVLPAPSGVVQAAVRTAEVLPAHVLTTLTEAVLGLLLGAVAGTALALAVVLRPRAGDALEPLVLLTQTVPTVVLAPLLILWTGFGMLPKVLLVALTVLTEEGLVRCIGTPMGLQVSVDAGKLDLVRGIVSGKKSSDGLDALYEG